MPRSQWMPDQFAENEDEGEIVYLSYEFLLWLPPINNSIQRVKESNRWKDCMLLWALKSGLMVHDTIPF